MASIAINMAIGLGTSFLLRLFEPTRRVEGPRISDLSAPRSNYGSGIPIVWGKCRLGGNLIWATNIREVVKKSRKRGKGFGPKTQTTDYSYFANFAVMLCRGPIARVNRIWLNGKLVYAHGGTANQFFNTYGRIYTGTTGQNPDPMIQSTIPVVANDYGLSPDPGTRAAEIAAIEQTYGITITNQQPGYRRRAYLVFEGLPLSDYNNAIPAVSVEVVAQESISLQQIIEELCAEAGLQPGEYNASALADVPVDGFILKNVQSINGALEELQSAYFFDVIRSQGVLRFVKQSRARDVVEPDNGMLAAHVFGQDRPDDYNKEVLTIEQLPSEVTVTFLDAAEDYAENSASYRRQSALPDNKKDVSVQLVLTANHARQMAERLLFQEWIEQRIKYELSLPLSMLHAEAGDLLQVNLSGQVETLEIKRVKLGANLICEYECTPSDKSFLSYTRQLPIRPVESEIQVEGDTILSVRDVNLVSDSDPEGLYVVATGEGTWRFGFLYASVDSTNYSYSSNLGPKGVIGGVIGDALPNALPYVYDENSILFVQLRSGDTLESVTDAQLDQGANKALVGDEIIQFGSAIYISDNQWRLERFRRGIRGTSHAISGHHANEVFLLLTGDDASVLVQEGTTADVGRTYYFKALNSYQTLDQVSALAVPILGNAYRPYAPSGVALTRNSGGDLIVSWHRHTRRNGRWQDGGDVAIPSSELRCLVEIRNGALLVQSAFVSGNSYTYLASDQVADFGSLQLSLSVTIYQLNDAVVSGFRGWPFTGTIVVSRSVV